MPARGGLFDDAPTPSQPPARVPERPVQPPPAPVPEPPAETPPPVTPPPPIAPPAPRSVPTPAKQPVKKTPRPAPVVPVKFPVPSAASLQQAEKQVTEIFGGRLASLPSPAEKAKIATEMLQAAGGTAEPTSKFVLLRKAEDTAAEAGDIDGALRAHEALRNAYQPRSWRISGVFFGKFSHPSLTVADAHRICQAIMADAGDSIAGDQYEAARELYRAAGPLARKLNDRNLSDQISQSLSSIGPMEAEQRRIALSQATLAKNPTDGPANTAVGSFHCFFKQDWAGGLPLLAKGDDQRLKTVATQELADPTEGTQQLAVAELWWNYAETQPAAAKAAIHLHAGKFYAQASPAMTGLAKAQADQRATDYLKSVATEAALASSATSSANAPPAPAAPDATGPEGFTTIVQMLRSVDPNLFPSTLAGWTPDRQTAVNNALQETLFQRQATLPLAVEMTTPSRLASMDSKQIKIGQFVARVHATFGGSASAEVQQLRIGQIATISGNITWARFDGTTLDVNLMDARLATPSQTPTPTAPPVKRAAAAPAPAMPPAADAPAAGGAGDFNSADQIAALLPVNQLPQNWNDSAAISRYASTVHSRYDDKTINCRLTISQVLPMGKFVMLKSEIPAGPTMISLRIKFDANDPDIQGVKKGQSLVISGRFAKGGAFVQSSSGLNLSDGKIVSK